jgi:beta-phosphoglucomutase-like phosphatase (HAD superfamily)
MHLVMFDIDGTLTKTMKVDEECFVRSFKDVFGFADVDTDWSHYHARRIPVSFTMFSRHALAGHRLRRKFRSFASISSNCSPLLHHSLHLHRLQGLTGCCRGSHRAARIGCR